MSEESTAIVLSKEEVQCLIPSGPESLGTVQHADSSPSEGQRAAVPYIGFRGEKTVKNREALDAAGIQVNDFYLKHIECIRVKPLTLHIIQYARFFTQQNDDMEVTGVSRVNSDDLFDQGYRETLLGVAAVKLSPGNYVPATFSLRSGHTAAIKDALALLEAAGKPSWGARSPKHAATLSIPVPGLRFGVTIWSTQEKPQGKSRPYNQGHGACAVTAEAEVPVLTTWAKDNWPAVQYVLTANNVKVEKLKRQADAEEEKYVSSDPGRKDPIPF